MTNPKTAAEILYPTTGSFEDLKVRRRGYPQEPKPDVATPKAQEFREFYDRHNPRYHRYDFKEPLCEMTTPGCTAEAAYAALLRFAVPGDPKAGHAVRDEHEAMAGFLDVPVGRVTVHVDAERKAVVNKTLPKHILHDGFAQRQIVVDGNTVFIRHYGEGVNRSIDLAVQNKLLAPAAFRESISQIREALQPPGPPSGRWPRHGTP
ncbi:MAG: hypothetical protein K2Y40_16115 [Reyranella sp.]|nr:hypothetical protein [Reyranella sp.]